jgi:4'-phosphopantetheinyl transferase
MTDQQQRELRRVGLWAGAEVWLAHLDLATEAVLRLRQMLSPDELERAARFVFDRDRRRFSVARARLRQVLGGRLGQAPETVRFRYGAYGKPSVEWTAADVQDSQWDGPVRFNASHSEDLALFAITHGRETGIDVEHVRADVDYLELADSYFSPTERAELRSLPRWQQRAAFYAGWTRKEAYLKARGVGLSLPLDSFSVTLGPDQPPLLLSARDDDPRRWRLIDLSVADGYRAALIVEQ